MSSVIADLRIEPDCVTWRALLRDADVSGGQLISGRTLREWRVEDRAVLGLATDRQIIATGHQTLLWHPGILVKYLAVEQFARASDLARANLIVDQHADEFGSFDIPIRRADGSLAVRRVELTIPRRGVPMGLHESFEPPAPRVRVNGASLSVDSGLERTIAAVAAHRHESNAALQMAGALEDLMQPWMQSMPRVCASDLLHTNLARKLLQTMADDPQGCAQLYNDAVRSFPEAGIGPLLVRDDYVELPLWRIRRDGTRMYAYDNDVQTWLEGGDITLMPRALFMTALVRLIMCDLFIHGTGGANYDRAMERWIQAWLALEPSPIAVATATMYLPILPASSDAADSEQLDVQQARQAFRQAWHDPARDQRKRAPSPMKQAWLERIAGLPAGSAGRRRAFFEMHAAIELERTKRVEAMSEARRRLEAGIQASSDRQIASRRDWPFSLYPASMIDALEAAVQKQFNCAQSA